jgi:hypothetical protein
MELWADVSFYCERTAAGFGHEPFNALSAALFVIVGLVMWRRLLGLIERVTALMFALVGVGSLALHLSGTMLGYALDLAGNFAFMTAFGVWVLVRLSGANPRSALILSSLVVILNTVLALNPLVHVLLGWIIDHYTVLAAVLLLTALAARNDRKLAGGLAASGFVLGIGLIFRFADGRWCDAWPFGTHAIWHVFYAASVLILLLTMAAAEPRSKPAGARV